MTLPSKTIVASSQTTQRGAALVTTLLIVALITVTVTAMTSKQQTAIQLAQNRQSQLQLKNLISAGETFAIAVLRRDKQQQERNNSDSTEDFWAQSLPPVPVDGATVEGCVIDLHGKFNLNNLIDDEGRTDEVEYQILQRLLTALTIDVTKAEAIRDWVDRDIDVTGANGAEDDFYTGQTPAYRAANGPMVSPSELLLVRGFRVTDEGGLDDYDQLLPHIVTLPENVAININTASVAVLSSLAPHMAALADEFQVVDNGYWESYPGCPEGGGLLDTLINAEEDPDAASAEPENPDDEPEGGIIYESIDEFVQQAKGPDPENENLDSLLDNGSIGVESRYYMSRVTVTRDEISITQYSIFVRDNNGAVTTIRRSRGTL